MVKNREELIQVARSNSAQMKSHLRNAISDFLKVQKVTPDELAYVLGISNDEMTKILDGDGNITVDALSKLLVATDMAVEIKPVSSTPLGFYGKDMPRSGGYPGPGGIPVDENGRPLPPPPGWHPGFIGGMPEPPIAGRTRKREERSADTMEEVPMETNKPLRDSRGRYVKRSAAPTPTKRCASHPSNPFIGISDAELINIIRKNIWDGEIDTDHATHEELADFVANKERIMKERADGTHSAPRRNEPSKPAIDGGGNAFNQFLGMLENIAKEAENNPSLMDAISRFMPKK